MCRAVVAFPFEESDETSDKDTVSFRDHYNHAVIIIRDLPEGDFLADVGFGAGNGMIDPVPFPVGEAHASSSIQRLHCLQQHQGQGEQAGSFRCSNTSSVSAPVEPAQPLKADEWAQVYRHRQVADQQCKLVTTSLAKYCAHCKDKIACHTNAIRYGQ